MRRLTIYFSVLALPLLLAACEKDSGTDTDGGESVPLSINTLQVDDIVVEASVPTRAATTLPADTETERHRSRRDQCQHRELDRRTHDRHRKQRLRTFPGVVVSTTLKRG